MMNKSRDHLPKILVASNFAAVAEQRLIHRLEQKAAAADGMAHLCYATGSTPGPVNARMRSHMPKILQNHVHVFHLDELLEPDDNTPYATEIDDLFTDLKVPRERIHLINGQAPDPYLEAKRYRDLIALYKPDIYVCGTDAVEGHLALNGEGSPAHSMTRVVDLSPLVQEKQKTYPHGSRATQAITVGMGELLDSNAELHLWATGLEKAPILNKAFNGAINQAINISLAREKGSKMLVIVDEAAASELLGDSPYYNLERA